MTFGTLCPNYPGPGGPGSQAPGWGRGRILHVLGDARGWSAWHPSLGQQRAAGQDVKQRQMRVGQRSPSWVRRPLGKAQATVLRTPSRRPPRLMAMHGHFTG